MALIEKNSKMDSDYNPKRNRNPKRSNSKKMPAVRFTNEKKIQLIQLYEQHPLLWYKNHRDYRNFTKRRIAQKKIADAMDYTSTILTYKWNRLREDFRTEQRKMQKSQNAKKAYVSKWLYYPYMRFLNSTAAEDDDNEIDGPNVKPETFSLASNAAASFSSKKTEHCSSTENELNHSVSMDSVSQFLGIIDELTKKIRPADHGDHLSVFGEFVSGQLRQMQSDKFRTKCTHEIQQILMDWQKKDDKLLQCYEQEYIEPQHNYTIQVDSAEDIDLLDAEDESVDFEEF